MLRDSHLIFHFSLQTLLAMETLLRLLPQPLRVIDVLLPGLAQMAAGGSEVQARFVARDSPLLGCLADLLHSAGQESVTANAKNVITHHLFPLAAPAA